MLDPKNSTVVENGKRQGYHGPGLGGNQMFRDPDLRIRTFPAPCIHENGAFTDHLDGIRVSIDQ